MGPSGLLPGQATTGRYSYRGAGDGDPAVTGRASSRAELAGAWADGQVYVALSRAATREGLCVRGLDRAAIKASAEVRRFYEAAAAWETE